MANVFATKNGNWSNPTVWNTGALPTAADDVYSNTFTVTIDISPTVLSVRNSSASGVTSGGSFVPTNGITLTCTGAGIVGILRCFISSLNVGESCSIVANVSTSGQVNNPAVSNLSSGTLNITGNIKGSDGANDNNAGVSNQGAGTVNITGNCTGGNATLNNAAGAVNSGSETLNITGSCISGTGSNAGAVNSGTGTLNVVGTIQSVTFPGIGPGGLSQVTILTGPFLTSAQGVNPVSAYRWFWAALS